MKITIIGNSSASPSVGRHPSAQVVQIGTLPILVDCGEGTQYQLIRHKVKYGNIDHVFISHLHGDHFFGLIGLITTYYLNRRNRPLTIYANSSLEKILDLQLAISRTSLGFPLIFNFLTPNISETVLETESLKVIAFPLNHSLDTHGFLFTDKHHPSKSYAYCSDTLFAPQIAQYVKNVALLYHEATFGDDKAESAITKYHSTARQAAELASIAGAGRLLIGHFSAKYQDPQELLLQSREVFANTDIAEEGKTYEL